MNHRAAGRIRNRSVAAKLFAVMLCTIAFCLPALAQSIGSRQLAPLQLPSPTRSQLVERFNLFVSYEKTGAYDKQFELLAREHLASLLHMHVDKEKYVEFKQGSQRAVGKLIELTVKDIKRMPNSEDELSLSVVAKIQKGQFTYSDRPICVASLVNGTWYFSLLYVN